ncbi:hypothetical protein Dimus_039339 [Dionaea muscipula]
MRLVELLACLGEILGMFSGLCGEDLMGGVVYVLVFGKNGCFYKILQKQEIRPTGFPVRPTGFLRVSLFWRIRLTGFSSTEKPGRPVSSAMSRNAPFYSVFVSFRSESHPRNPRCFIGGFW